MTSTLRVRVSANAFARGEDISHSRSQNSPSFPLSGRYIPSPQRIVNPVSLSDFPVWTNSVPQTILSLFIFDSRATYASVFPSTSRISTGTHGYALLIADSVRVGVPRV